MLSTFFLTLTFFVQSFEPTPVSAAVLLGKAASIILMTLALAVHNLWARPFAVADSWKTGVRAAILVLAAACAAHVAWAGALDIRLLRGSQAAASLTVGSYFVAVLFCAVIALLVGSVGRAMMRGVRAEVLSVSAPPKDRDLTPRVTHSPDGSHFIAARSTVRPLNSVRRHARLPLVTDATSKMSSDVGETESIEITKPLSAHYELSTRDATDFASHVLVTSATTTASSNLRLMLDDLDQGLSRTRQGPIRSRGALNRKQHEIEIMADVYQLQIAANSLEGSTTVEGSRA